MLPRSLLLALRLALFTTLLLIGTSVITLAVADPSGPAIAVADFSGPNKELNRFLSETLLTDLAQSDKLHLVERGEIRQAFAELKLQSSGLAEQPQRIQELGRLVSADHLIVGSYMLRDDQIIINARLINIKTGRLAQRGAANISGDRRNLLSLSHQLAKQFHRRITGEELDLDGDNGVELTPVANRPQPLPRSPEVAGDDGLSGLRSRGLMPTNARGNEALREKDLRALIQKVGRLVSRQSDAPVSGYRSDELVTRVRAMTALVKLMVAPDVIESYQNTSRAGLIPDLKNTPSWGLPYLAAAVEEGWWSSDRALRAREFATWAFIATLLSRMPLDGSSSAPELEPVKDGGNFFNGDAFTGLIIDAGDMRVERSMNVRILDEDGNVLYPNPNHVPGYDFLQDKGMATYCHSLRAASRAGQRPLIVRAVDKSGVNGADLVVTNISADRIREANRRGRFLKRWAVCVLLGTRD